MSDHGEGLEWQGSDAYIASDDLQRIVNVAVQLERPLLIKGEPGTGKTLLAESIAASLGMRLVTWHVKSTSKATEGLYVYDTVQRLYDSRFQDGDVSDIRQYIRMGPLGEAFSSDERVVLLIDEIDKADVEFPNDLLHELDAMSFTIPETGDTVKAKHRPIVVITSNSERELPDAFLRRAVFHYIAFPDQDLMSEIVQVHFPDIGAEMLEGSLRSFYRLRGVEGLRKKPSTSELIDWIAALISSGFAPSELDESTPFLGTLIKREQDLDVLQRNRRWH
ncbi:MAG: MoxR family ATPase [Myxococcota bacterium]|nr:MoxR family ATPase [Myxococcota bacterium]